MDGVEGNKGGPMATGQECPGLPPLAESEEGHEIILDGQRLLVEPATAEEQAVIRQMRARSGWLSEGKKWVGVVLLSLAVGSGFGGGAPKQVTRTGGHGGTIRRGVRTAPGSRRKEESQETNEDGRPECRDGAGRCVHRMPDGQCQSSNGPCRWFAGVEEVRNIVVEIRREMRVAGKRPKGDGRWQRAEGEGNAASAKGKGPGESTCSEVSDQCSISQIRETAGRYVLRRIYGGWKLIFDGQEGFLPEQKGVPYVAALLLDPPRTPLHGAELGERACGHLVIEGQRNLALEDQATMEAKRRARRKCQAVLADPRASEVERQEAQAELAEIDAWAWKHLRGTEGNEQRQVRAIRQAIRRLLDGLRTAEDGKGRPDEVLRAFGEHLEKYLWRPSVRGGWGRNARVRAGLAGRFTYEPPDGVKWSD